MYNLLHLALLGGYEGQVTVENFWEWAIRRSRMMKAAISAQCCLT